MTRPRLILVVSALALLAAFAIAQVSTYARAPLIVGSAYAGQTHAQIAAETSCETLRSWYQVEYNVWRGGVKRGQDQAVAPHHDAMVEILRRIGWLERRGKCGG